MVSTKILSSLAKVFPDEEPKNSLYLKGTMLANEKYSFQLAYFTPKQIWEDVFWEIDSPLKDFITVYSVGLIPVEIPIRFPHDGNLLRDTPGLYPDLLTPLQPGDKIPIPPQQWRSLWFTITNPEACKGQTMPIKITLKSASGKKLAEESHLVEVIDLKLPQQSLIHTEWLHTDCLATYYDLEIFSEEYWKVTEKFIATAVDHGVNMILTPLFTPPLDTAVGHERPTVQLIDVKKQGDQYEFGFDKLERWTKMCNNVGITYLEFSHLFTQWGARHAPKIMAEEEGELKQIFGWDTNAAGEEYQKFLDQFLPQLVNFIAKNNLEKRVFFHISDEPGLGDLDSYSSASAIMKKHLEGFPIMDALSDYEFYKSGAVQNPIPATNHIEPFLENNVPNLWTYYCSAQGEEVSQRFLSMPSARNRILGLQLYKFKIVGFLHWGYNFYYSQGSKYALDPFKETDGGHWVPAGDTFLVYPGNEVPLPSLRLKVFNEGLQDLRALQLLEKYLGREKVLTLLEEELAKPLTFKEYPQNETWLLEKRAQINRLLKKLI